MRIKENGIQEEIICCNKPMIHTKKCQSLTNADIQQWICLECGRYINLIDDRLTEEELENYKECEKQ